MWILLTGCDGFIGARLKQDLQRAGHQVLGTCYDREPGGNEVFLDLGNPESFDGLPTTPFDAVVHAAGIVDQRAIRKRMLAVNAAGTRRLLLWAEANGTHHFIYLSSVSVYGFSTMGQNRSEDRTHRSPGIPAVPYMASKVRAERWVEAGRLGYTILRLPAVLGRGDSYLSPTIIPALQKGTFFSCGGGQRLVSLMFVANLGPLIQCILQSGPLDRAFNCCDAHVPWQTLVAEYARCLGVELPGKRRSVLGLITHLGDKRYLLLSTFSRFGAHFPDALLHSAIPHDHPYRWQEGVAEAVAGYSGEVRDLR